MAGETGLTKEQSAKVAAVIDAGGNAVYVEDRGGWVLTDAAGGEADFFEVGAPPQPGKNNDGGKGDGGDQGDDHDDKDGEGAGPRRAPSIGEDADGDGWVDGKKPLEHGSVDMPPLLSGRNIEAVLKDYTEKEPGPGLREVLAGRFLPTTGDSEADTQIQSYEDSHLTTFNALLEAPEASFMEGPILHNLSATEDAAAGVAEALEEARGELEPLYQGGVGDPQMDERMAEIAGRLSILTETGEAVQRLGQGLGRTGDGYNSIAASIGAGVQDAYAQIADYASDHAAWEDSSGGAREPRPKFDFLKSELEAAVTDARDSLEGQVASEMMTASAALDPAAGGSARDEDGGRGTPNEGGSTPAPPASGDAPAPAPAAPQQGGSTPAASPASSGSSSSSGEDSGGGKGGGPSREAAERLAGLLSGSGAGAQPVQGGMAPPMPQPSMPQPQPFPMPNLDPGAAMGVPTMPTGAPGMVQTDDPYEALLHPTTHLTRDFSAGDMSTLREGNASGRDAATIRPYTAEARSADALLTSPPAAGPGATTPRPTALGADMRPLDKDSDGKVDKDSVPATRENVTGEEVKASVTVGGEEHPVKVTDPRLLEMMNLMGEASEAEPLEILEAAAEAGVPLESYGEMLEDPTQAKAGDVVISTKGSGFYLGAGEVLLETGEVVPLADVLELRPPQSGIFRLELPELPDEVEEGDGEDQAPKDPAASPSEGGEAPPAEGDAEGEPEAPAAPAAGGAAPAPAPEPEPLPEPLPGGAFMPGEMPNPSIAPEHADADGDGIPDDNNGNGIVDSEEPLPETPTPAPAPVEEAPEPAPEPEVQEPVPEPEAPAAEAAPEPLFEGSASLDLDAAGLRATGSAEARIRDIPFEGDVLGTED